ncbi:transposase [Synechococcus sp. HK01-R]|nr:transposase [Synechococcus sp. HK01-R]
MEQIIRKLKTSKQLIAQGKTVIEVCRLIEVTQPTYHRWRQQNGGMQAEVARRLTQLEKENARLKKLLAEAELENAIDVAPGNWSRVNESPHPARLGRGLHHETHPPHTRADHPQAQNR